MADVQLLRDELEGLARANGWSRSEGLCSRLRSALNSTGLIAGDGVDAGPLRQALFPDATVHSFSELGNDASIPLSSLFLVGVFSCERLLSAVEVQQVQAAFHGRPGDSYCFVYLNPEALDSSDAVNRWQRGVWRLLVPDPKPDYDRQSLPERGIFLWAASPQGELSERVRSDVESLVTRNQRGNAAGSGPLLHLGLLHALSLAREEADAASRAQTLAEAPQFAAVRESLRNLRRRLINRLDADASQLADESVGLLRGLRADLEGDLRRALRGKRQGNWDRHNPKELRESLRAFVSEAVQSWLNTVEQRMRARGQEVADDTRTLIMSADWSLVNSCYREERYPGALLDVLRDKPPVIGRPTDSSTWRGSGGAKEPGSLLDVLGYVFSGGVVVSAASLGHPMAGVIAGTLLTPYFWLQYQKRNFREAEELGRATIDGIIHEMTAYVTASSSACIGVIREALIARFEEIDRVLGIQERASASPGAVPKPEAQVKLSEIEQQLLRMTPLFERAQKS